MAAEEALCETYMNGHPADAARVLERLPAADVAAVFDTVRPAVVAEVVGRMVPSACAECLVQLTHERAARVVEALPADVAAAVLRRLDSAVRAALLDALGDAARPLRRLLDYRDGTAASMMDPHALALPDDVTVGDALARVERAARHMLYYLYVVNREGTLVGVLDVAELMQAKPTVRLAAVMHQPVAAVPASAERGALLAHPGWVEYHALPVVDDQGRLLGAVRYQTFRRLEAADSDRAPGPLVTVMALGELYWLGASGFLKGLAGSVLTTVDPGEPEVGDGA